MSCFSIAHSQYMQTITRTSIQYSYLDNTDMYYKIISLTASPSSRFNPLHVSHFAHDKPLILSVLSRYRLVCELKDKPPGEFDKTYTPGYRPAIEFEEYI